MEEWRHESCSCSKSLVTWKWAYCVYLRQLWVDLIIVMRFWLSGITAKSHSSMLRKSVISEWSRIYLSIAATRLVPTTIIVHHCPADFNHFVFSDICPTKTAWPNALTSREIAVPCEAARVSWCAHDFGWSRMERLSTKIVCRRNGTSWVHEKVSMAVLGAVTAGTYCMYSQCRNWN